MIGNDIVDLALARKQSNWKRKGFLDKIFSQREQGIILNSPNPEVTVWNLWSRKEASYKIFNRQTQIRAFIPLQLECFDEAVQQDGVILGRTVYQNHVYYTQSTIDIDFIETIALLNPCDFDKIKSLPTAVAIVKINGIPSYFDDSKVLKPLSKSRHGRFERMVSI